MFTYMQGTKYVRPYQSEMLNNMEIAASFTSMMTLLFGLFFLDTSSAINENISLVTFIFLIMINITFLVYWALKMGPILARSIIRLH